MNIVVCTSASIHTWELGSSQYSISYLAILNILNYTSLTLSFTIKQEIVKDIARQIPFTLPGRECSGQYDHHQGKLVLLCFLAQLKPITYPRAISMNIE